MEGNNSNNEYDIELLINRYSPLVSYFDTIASHILATVMIHPLQCSSTLLLLGHRPLLHAESRWYYLGLVLPNFVYTKEIFNNEGFTGCFRGVAACIVSNFLYETVYFFITVNNVKSVLNSGSGSKFNKIVKWNLIGVIVADIVSHPFLMVSNRQIAQYIGKETIYDCGIFKALLEVAKREGILKWFSGIVPKVIADVVHILVVFKSVHIFSKYVNERKYATFFMYGIISVVRFVSYPFIKASTCMMVDGSGLKAVSPQSMMTYHGLHWIKCLNDLSRDNRLYHSSFLLWRPYIPFGKSY